MTLQRARDLLPGPAGRVLDRALLVLIDQLETDRERTALLANPYQDDSDLAWQAPPGSDLDYDGDPPEEIRESRR